MDRYRLVPFIIVLTALLAVAAYWLQRNKPIAVTVAQVESRAIQRAITNSRAGTLACHRTKLSPSLGG